jgi:hypothetical protein
MPRIHKTQAQSSALQKKKKNGNVSTTTVESSMEAPQQTKNKTTI